MAAAPLTIASKTVTIDFDEYVGDTLSLVADYRTLPKPGGAQIDLTGSTAQFIVKADKADVTPLIDPLSVPVTLGDLDNNIKVKLTDEQTSLLGEGKFFYAVVVTDSLGDVNTLITGKIKLKLR